MATVISGSAIAASVRAEVADGVSDLITRVGRTPGLATILVGADAASRVYVASKRKACVAAGMTDHHRELPGSATQDQVSAVIDELAADDRVSGILLQLPLPDHLDAGALIDRIPAAKDVDGLTMVSAGALSAGKPGLRPCTPLGVIEILDQSGVEIGGKRVVVVGRSALVGRPLAQLFVQRDATVTIAHSRTVDLAAVTREAEILVAAAGVPELIGAEHIAEGAVVIDVGIHRTGTGLVGDVDFAAAEIRASQITPVPGGVGPMTIAMLLRNTLRAAEAADQSHIRRTNP
ncbi:bifunctional methylenetetrahydrofolate dehydrogenase/methenyltetrahydrofolate cyclohydrolase FolD [Microbacterium sp. A8/3-1]|uniref:Bifunctional protein FolD n=1 Tax=Microbacterium sp. A8/3-1 TaxID=3160749 RepID=A0AAU7VWB7_9MICO